MKKRVISGVLSFLLVSMLFLGNVGMGSYVEANTGNTIKETFPDANMAQAVADIVAGGDIEAKITEELVESTTSLDLASKNIASIEGIDVFNNLNTLNVNSNQLTEVPDSIGTLSNLKYLYLYGNQFTELPDSVSQLSQLKNLYLTNNQLTKLPEDIGQLTKLVSLDLTNNQLTELPDSIGQLSSLWTLGLSNNQLTELPDSISQLSSIISLELTDNQLTKLPDSIGQIGSLQNLYLANNQLTELPDSITQLSNLRGFYIDQNHLINIPQAQYDFITQLGAYTMSDQSYEETLTEPTVASGDYTFAALPAYDQLLSYGMVFQFTLTYPDGSTVVITPVIENGQITIDGDLLTQEGSYTLAVNGTGSEFDSVSYSHLFEVKLPVSPEPGDINPTKPVPEEKTIKLIMPKTGGLSLFLNMGLLGIGVIGVVNGLKKKK